MNRTGRPETMAEAPPDRRAQFEHGREQYTQERYPPLGYPQDGVPQNGYPRNPYGQEPYPTREQAEEAGRKIGMPSFVATTQDQATP